jgi:hypothetical protein
MSNNTGIILDKSNMLAMPDGLTTRARRAYQLIVECLQKLGITTESTGGCRTFYSPSEWKEKGETSGRNAILIVVYDGSSVKYHFSMDAAYETKGNKVGSEIYEKTEAMQTYLNEADFRYEELTRWCAAIYDDRK